jgi:hypothetical protein
MHTQRRINVPTLQRAAMQLVRGISGGSRDECRRAGAKAGGAVELPVRLD